MNRSILHPAMLIAAAVLLAALFIIVGIVLYRAGVLMILSSPSIPFVMVDPSAYMPKFI